jgi:aconitate hydratase
MGVLPLQLHPGASAASLGLDGTETYTVHGISAGLTPGQDVTVEVRREDGTSTSFQATVRIDAAAEVEYYRNGGILPMVLRQILAARA